MVPANLFKVVVFARYAHTFLRVDSALQARFIGNAEEDVLELVHPGIGEKKRRVVLGKDWRAPYKGMLAFFKEINKAVAYFICFHNDER